MPWSRRKFLRLATVAAGGLVAAQSIHARTTPAFMAIAFDGFPIFDPRPVFALAETLFPGNGAALSNVWRTRQFEYQWLRALAGRYADFLETTESALVFAADTLHLDLTAEKRDRLMEAYLHLGVWPDVPDALSTLNEAGMRLAILSNMTQGMMDAGLRQAGLTGAFEHVISTDRIKSYKPDPRAYQLLPDALGLERSQILFAAFAGWDVSGAKWFGYPTFWVNRLKSPGERLGTAPDSMSQDLEGLTRFALATS